jgi:hypothetical protein
VADEEIRLEREVEVAVHVAGAAGPASMTGRGRLAVTHGGRRTVVTAHTRVDEASVRATGEVRVDDALVVSRRWSG